MSSRRLALYATWASLAWSALLTGLAAMGNTWVLDRVAGGAYAGETMPLPMRILYGVITVLLIGVAWLASRYERDDVTRQQRNFGRFIILVFLVSAVLNAISHSEPERYNAIAAVVTLVGIAILRRRPQRDWVDLTQRR